MIGGYTMRDGVANALLAGLYREGRLHFIGKVGTGRLKAADWRELTKVVTQIETEDCPFFDRHPDMRNAHWVQPLLTAKIAYSEWRVLEERMMRQPSIQAFVAANPEECTFE